jgi:hypothetical protein
MFVTTPGNAIPAPMVAIRDLELNNYYIVDVPVIDDYSGEETIECDMVWYHEDNVPGQAKRRKLFKFCRRPKTLAISQMIGAQFYGPVKIQLPERRAVPNTLQTGALDQLFKEMNRNDAT